MADPRNSVRFNRRGIRRQSQPAHEDYRAGGLRDARHRARIGRPGNDSVGQRGGPATRDEPCSWTRVRPVALSSAKPRANCSGGGFHRVTPVSHPPVRHELHRRKSGSTSAGTFSTSPAEGIPGGYGSRGASNCLCATGKSSVMTRWVAPHSADWRAASSNCAKVAVLIPKIVFMVRSVPKGQITHSIHVYRSRRLG